MLRDDFTINALCPFNQKRRRGQFYTMNIRGQEIITLPYHHVLCIYARWQQLWLPVVLRTSIAVGLIN